MIRKSKSRIAFEIVNYTFFAIFCITIIIPFLNVIAVSLSSREAITKQIVGIWPVGFNTAAYEKIAINGPFWRTFFNTVFLTVVNTSLTIIIALCAGYAVANKYLAGKKLVMNYFLIPYYFSGGLIPTYLLINGLGLYNTYWALILPAITNIYYIIVFRNLISTLPKELIESAELDGASQPRILFNIIIPLIIPTIAAFIVFSAVANWNSWFSSMVYISDRKKWTLQYQLRDILVNAALVNPDLEKEMATGTVPMHPENLKMAALMVTILPIIIVYPFVQKYFMSGVLVGAVKG